MSQDQTSKNSPFFDIRENNYFGLSCTCVEEYPQDYFFSKFFLFSDIDTKDPEVLRLVMQEFARAKLSFWILETKKGYHIISPNLLNINEWTDLKNKIGVLSQTYYKFLVIRIQNKKGDNLIGWYDEFDDLKHKKSLELFDLMDKRILEFDHQFYKLSKGKDQSWSNNTHLQTVSYSHHEFIEEP